MRFMQTESVLQTKNRSGQAKNRFSVALYLNVSYLKNPNISEICFNHPKSSTRWLFLRVMHPKDAARIANSVDTDQTVPLGSVCLKT